MQLHKLVYHAENLCIWPEWNKNIHFRSLHAQCGCVFRFKRVILVIFDSNFTGANFSSVQNNGKQAFLGVGPETKCCIHPWLYALVCRQTTQASDIKWLILLKDDKLLVSPPQLAVCLFWSDWRHSLTPIDLKTRPVFFHAPNKTRSSRFLQQVDMESRNDISLMGKALSETACWILLPPSPFCRFS